MAVVARVVGAWHQPLVSTASALHLAPVILPVALGLHVKEAHASLSTTRARQHVSLDGVVSAVSVNSPVAAPPFVKPMKSVLAARVCASLIVPQPAAVQTAAVVHVLVLLVRLATRPLRLVPPVLPPAQMASAATQTTVAAFAAALQVRSAKVASV
jgi:hypothetical protein